MAAPVAGRYLWPPSVGSVMHTFDPDGADRLERPDRYRYLSRDELIALLDPDPGWTVGDVGSGTGFYTDDVAAQVERVVAVDIQPAMHAYYLEKGMPPGVCPVTAAAGALPLADGALDGAVSTMTFHEFATPAALADVRRALAAGGRLAVADWSAAGEGEAGPPLGERFDAATARDRLADAGFAVRRTEERPETFVALATAPG